jgi:ABC-type transporter Mla subunit MlaD
MNGRTRREQGMLGNPILIGALTVLATIVAVALAYQANNGLPFVPKYTLHVQVADASELTHGAEVHVGGALVGLVDTVSAARASDGQPIAVLNLKLDKVVQPLAVNSTFDVRLKGAIGLKYLQIIPGNSKQTYPDNATVPLARSTSEVDLDQVLSMFDPATRKGVQESTVGFSDALASRGSDINNAIGAFLPLVRDLGPVATNLSSRKTDLGGFFRGLESFSSALTPVAQAQADLYVNLDTTFRALAPVAVPFLQDWISETPPTFSTVIADSPSEQSFLTDTAQLFKDLRPAVALVPASAPVLSDAFVAGANNLPGTKELDERLLSLSKSLEKFGQTPAVKGGLDRLTQVVKVLRPPLSFLTPMQATCNYVSLFLRNTGSSLAEPFGNGTALRFDAVVIDDVLGSEAVPSQRPYLTENASSNNEHGALHVDPYPNTASPGQTRECSAGNERYAPAAAIGNPPGNVGTHTQKTTRPK